MPESLTLPGQKRQGHPFGSTRSDASPVSVFGSAPSYKGQADVLYGWPSSKQKEKQQPQGQPFHVGRRGALKTSLPATTYLSELLQVQDQYILEGHKLLGDEWSRHPLQEPSSVAYSFAGQEPSEVGPFGTFLEEAPQISTSRPELLGQTDGRVRVTHSRRPLGSRAHSYLHSLHSRVMRTIEEPANFKAAVGALTQVRQMAMDLSYEVPTPSVIDNARQILGKVCEKDSREFFVYPMPYGGISIDAATPPRTRVVIICGPDGTAQGLVGRNMEVESKDYGDIGEVPDAFILDALADLPV